VSNIELFKPNAVPAHAQALFEDSNIADKQTVPSLGYEGKVWSVALDGKKTRLTKRNADGDEEPVSVMKVVVLDYAKRRGRTYYEGGYNPDKPAAPLCWSDDGIAPDASVAQKQSPTCEGCPWSIKGSRTTDTGVQTTACSQHRMLAVVPANKLDFTPLRLKIAITSDYDKLSPDQAAQGWHAFQAYTEMLTNNGVKHTAALVTKMKFDSKTAYPKIFFAADRWLDEAEVEQVIPLTKNPDVQKLLGGSWTPAGVDGVPVAAAPAPAVVEEEEDDIILPEEQPVQQPAQAETAPPKSVRQKATPAPAAAEAEKATPAVSTEVPPEVAALLKEWGDD
jgi:hypothetical protein